MRTILLEVEDEVADRWEAAPPERREAARRGFASPLLRSARFWDRVEEAHALDDAIWRERYRDATERSALEIERSGLTAEEIENVLVRV